MTVAAILAVVPPRFIGQIVDALNVGTELGVVIALALGSVLFAAGEATVRGFSRFQIINASRRVEYEVRNDLLAHLQTMHLGYFQHQRIGDLMARLTNDLTAVRQMYGFGIVMTASTTMLLVFTIISMLGVSVKLTILTLLLMPVASGTFWIVGRKVHHKFQELQAQFGEMSTKAQENFSGIRVVKAFSQEEPEIAGFADVNAEYVRRAVDLAKLNGLIWPAMAFIMGIAVLATLYVGGRDAIEGHLTIGQLVQFIAYQLRNLIDFRDPDVSAQRGNGWCPGFQRGHRVGGSEGVAQHGTVERAGFARHLDRIIG